MNPRSPPSALVAASSLFSFATRAKSLPAFTSLSADSMRSWAAFSCSGFAPGGTGTVMARTLTAAGCVKRVARSSLYFFCSSSGVLSGVVLRLGVRGRHFLAEHEGVEPDVVDGGRLVLRLPVGLHLVVADVGAGQHGLNDLAAQHVAAPRLLEARDAHAVAVLDQALVVVVAEFSLLLELGTLDDRLGHLRVGDHDAQLLGLLRDELLIDEALERLFLEVVLPGVVGRVLAAPHLRHLPQAVRVGLVEVARRHQVAVDLGRPRLRRAGAEPRRPAAEGDDEARDDHPEDEDDQRGPGVRPHHVQHRASGSSFRRAAGSKLPFPRPLGKLDTLGKPRQRCKRKNREGPVAGKGSFR